jgi:hypothetical protein
VPDHTFRAALLATIPVLFAALAATVSTPARPAAKPVNHSEQAQMDCDPLDPVCAGYVHRG